jgi:hypothetical protein
MKSFAHYLTAHPEVFWRKWASYTAYIADHTISSSSSNRVMGSIVKPGPSSMHLLDVFNGLEHCTKRSAMLPHQHLSGNENSQYPTKTFGFSVAGKWPTPFIAWCFPPVIFSQVAWPISGVLLQSYSPVNMYTGHFLVSMLDMRLRPSHPPARNVSHDFPSSESHSPRIACYRR